MGLWDCDFGKVAELRDIGENQLAEACASSTRWSRERQISQRGEIGFLVLRHLADAVR
jgi:hypothetical protein